tara:strand:- start:299 stop:532 length:234 start_codon:yes stop_codon:yes gene_type:complete
MSKKLKTETADIRNLSNEDIGKELDEAYKRQFSLNLQRATRQITNHREIPKVRRQIARLKTIIRQREILKINDEENK